LTTDLINYINYARNTTRFPEGTVIKPSHLLVFRLDEQQYALRLGSVERIIRAAAVTPLPKAPDIVLGILDIQGEVVPVINVRKRFRQPEKEIRPADHFIIAKARSLKVALVVDETHGVVEEDGTDLIAAADDMLFETKYVAGVTRTRDGLVLIHDLDTFLSQGEEKVLLDALEQA